MSNDYTLPPIGRDTLMACVRDLGFTTWAQTDKVVCAISPTVLDYGHAVAAPLLARIAELETQIESDRKRTHGYSQDFVDSLRAGCDRLRAENEALRADLEWISVEWGGIRHDYAAWVLRRGGTGDLGDLRSFIDAARSTGQSKAEGDSNAHR